MTTTAGTEAAGPVLGLSETVGPGERDRAERLFAGCESLGVRHVRTGFGRGLDRNASRAWEDWVFRRRPAGVQILPSLPCGPAPGRPESDDDLALRDFEDFLVRFGSVFEWVEIVPPAGGGNGLGPRVERSAEGMARLVQSHGKKLVLGGCRPFDPGWAELLGRALRGRVGAVGIHHVPSALGTWPRTLARVRELSGTSLPGMETWITETGYSTWRHDEFRQVQAFLELQAAPVGRVYWISGADLSPDEAPEDPVRAWAGLWHSDGSPKLLFRLWSSRGRESLDELAGMANGNGGPPAEDAAPPKAGRSVASMASDRRGHTLITGGAGFIGTNLADRLLSSGERVTVYDNLSRPGSERNLRWLYDTHRRRLEVRIADVRDRVSLREALKDARQVFHLAAQVAVTTSVTDPGLDFEVNLQGTFILLNELRRRDDPPPLVFTSTNKVYGTLPDLDLRADPERYEPVDGAVRTYGISESRGLDFCSPYGCSKGAADQYVLDFARTYDLPLAVFRMSCIYGPHQNGTEDQGWVAYLMRRALERAPITIYGDGRQVRDILFVEDLVDALLLAQRGIARLRGQAFNIGGGPFNTISLMELVALLSRELGKPPAYSFADWRTGDQKYYVSDTRKFGAAAGWSPRVPAGEGLGLLLRWLRESGLGRESAGARV